MKCLILASNFVGGGVDFESSELSVTVTPPATTQCIAINITDDNVREGDEHFSVTVRSPDNPVVLRVSTAVVTIKDNDGMTFAPHGNYCSIYYLSHRGDDRVRTREL